MVDMPCQGCNKRWVDTGNSTNCHSHCEEYQKAVELNKQVLAHNMQQMLLPRCSSPYYGGSRNVNPARKRAREWL